MDLETTVTWGFFVWNAHKERTNVIRHRIDFQKASQAFLDKNCIITFDQKHSLKEQRWYCIGRVEKAVITVRFTYRENRIRIFGAGNWRKGRHLYEAKISSRP